MKHISPVAALLALFFYSFIVALQEHIYVFMFLPVLLLIALNFSALKSVLKRLFFLNIFVAIIVLTLILQNESEKALLIFIRSNLILSTALLLFYKRDEFDIALALQSLHFPHKLTSIVFFTTKSIFLIKLEFELFKKTLYIRGFKPKTDLLSYKVMAGFVGILIIKTYEMAKNLQKSMLIRGFEGRIYTLRTYQVLSYCDVVLYFVISVSILQWGVVV